MTRYQVIDCYTGKVLGEYASRRRASPMTNRTPPPSELLRCANTLDDCLLYIFPILEASQTSVARAAGKPPLTVTALSTAFRHGAVALRRAALLSTPSTSEASPSNTD